MLNSVSKKGKISNQIFMSFVQLFEKKTIPCINIALILLPHQISTANNVYFRAANDCKFSNSCQRLNILYGDRAIRAPQWRCTLLYLQPMNTCQFLEFFVFRYENRTKLHFWAWIVFKTRAIFILSCQLLLWICDFRAPILGIDHLYSNYLAL